MRNVGDSFITSKGTILGNIENEGMFKSTLLMMENLKTPYYSKKRITRVVCMYTIENV